MKKRPESNDQRAKNRTAKSRTGRRLLVEKLENRSVLASDCFHNFMLPEDTDGSGSVSPLDALAVISQINSGSTDAANAPTSKLVDVNGDDSLSPLDALSVINYLNAETTDATTTRRSSHIENEKRIEKIERDIERNKLPPNQTLEQARQTLETLKAGGRPELGDRIVNGILEWEVEVEGPDDNGNDGPEDDGPDDNGPDDNGNDGPEDDGPDDNGNDGPEDDGPDDNGNDGPEDDGPDDNGPDDNGNDGPEDDGPDDNGPDDNGTGNDDNTPRNLEKKFDQYVRTFSKRLAAFGVNSTIITTITGEIRQAHQSGTDMTLEQIRTRLNELGTKPNVILPSGFLGEKVEKPENPEDPENPENPEDPENPEGPEKPN